MENDIRHIFSRNLRMLMQEQNKDGKQLAKGLGCRPSTVSKWLNMKTEPTLTYIYKLTQFLNCTFEDLMQD